MAKKDVRTPSTSRCARGPKLWILVAFFIVFWARFGRRRKKFNQPTLVHMHACDVWLRQRAFHQGNQLATFVLLFDAEKKYKKPPQLSSPAISKEEEGIWKKETFLNSDYLIENRLEQGQTQQFERRLWFTR